PKVCFGFRPPQSLAETYFWTFCFSGPAFPVYGQNKPSITPFGQPMAVPGMSNNPFMAGSFPSGGSSTNPFL
uniref:Uncharacterized protein n=1 Tax=Oryzias melastigma TaxID=30732 RepID=A0A3B3C580_ORYME